LFVNYVIDIRQNPVEGAGLSVSTSNKFFSYLLMLQVCLNILPVLSIIKISITTKLNFSFSFKIFGNLKNFIRLDLTRVVDLVMKLVNII